MMDGNKDSGSTATPEETATHTAAEDDAPSPPTDGVSPLGFEASGVSAGSEKSSSLRGGQDSVTLGTEDSKDLCRLGEESSPTVQRPPTAGHFGEGSLGASFLFPSTAASGTIASSSTLTEAISSSPTSSPGLSSGQSSYTSFEHLVDEPRDRNILGHYGNASDGTDDEQYRKKLDKGKSKEVVPPPVTPAKDQQIQPLHNIPWVKDPERPPQKLPIRFTDCVGRNFVWPWKKAKTWKGAKRLVESAFLYVDVLGPHVFAGHYDLTIQGMWSDPKSAAINPELASYHPETTHQDAESTSPDNLADGLGSASSASSSCSQGGPPPFSNNVAPQTIPKVAGRGAIILPELWEDVVEPGLLIVMRMWPIAPSTSTHSHPPPLPAVPMPPPLHHHPHGNAVGRGRGAATAAGRGSAHPPPPPPLHPGWHQPPRRRGPPSFVVEICPPKGKTRKRQDGL